MLRPLLSAIGFLTRLPLPQVACSERDMARGAGYFAWVGGLIALALWGAAQITPWSGARLAALLIVASWAWITGGLHLDGLADTVDGFSGGRGQHERTLEIMRDSRIGSHGALALVLLVLFKVAALERLLGQGGLAWLVTPALARFLCTLLIAFFPYARAQGLGSVFAGQVGWREVALGSAFAASALWCAGPAVVWGALAALLTGLLVALHFKRRLGGLTGDGYGAAIELSEAACLVALSLR